MKLKRILAAFLCAAMALSLAACSDTESPNDDPSVSDSKKNKDKDKDKNSGGENNDNGENESSQPKEEENKDDSIKYAEPPESDFTCQYTDNGRDLILKYNGTETAIKIPSTIKGEPVKRIVSFYCSKVAVEHVILPDSVTYIIGGAFSSSAPVRDGIGCALKSIEIPDSVTWIAKGAFGGTEYWENHYDGSFFIDNNRLFISSPALEGDVVIPDGVTMIGGDAFSNNYNIASVIVPSSVEVIYSGAFSDCMGLKSVTLSDGIKRIDGAFSRCISLENINIPDSVTDISKYAFEDCERIQATYKGETYDHAHRFDLYAAINGN